MLPSTAGQIEPSRIIFQAISTNPTPTHDIIQMIQSNPIFQTHLNSINKSSSKTQSSQTLSSRMDALFCRFHIPDSITIDKIHQCQNIITHPEQLYPLLISNLGQNTRNITNITETPHNHTYFLFQLHPLIHKADSIPADGGANTNPNVPTIFALRDIARAFVFHDTGLDPDQSSTNIDTQTHQIDTNYTEGVSSDILSTSSGALSETTWHRSNPPNIFLQSSNNIIISNHQATSNTLILPKVQHNSSHNLLHRCNNNISNSSNNPNTYSNCNIYNSINDSGNYNLVSMQRSTSFDESSSASSASTDSITAAREYFTHANTRECIATHMMFLLQPLPLFSTMPSSSSSSCLSSSYQGSIAESEFTAFHRAEEQQKQQHSNSQLHHPELPSSYQGSIAESEITGLINSQLQSPANK